MPRSSPRPPPARGKLPARLARAAVLIGLLLACAAVAGAAAAARAPVVVIPVAGAIGPASADFVVRGLERAAREHAPLAIVQLDTPGGLDTSMRQIIKAIVASGVPVAAFVAPGGARAASAGTYIVYASHVAAMAPGTNLGAASPVQLGIGGQAPAGGRREPAGAPGAAGAGATDTESIETRKALHDAAAYIRGLAQLRGRNAEWAERAVREAVSLPANDALAQHVVDLLANDPADLAAKLDGRTIVTATGAHRLDTAQAPLETLEPDWRSRLLATIADPSVALVLVTLGMYGLFFEFANPGFVLPGVAGAISLLVGLFALQLLPISYAGLALVLLGIAFLIAETFLPTFGALGVGGIVAFAIGALMLIDTDVPGYGVPWPVIASLAAAGAILVFGVSGFALRARRRPVVTGAEAIVGSIGEVLDDGLVPDQPPQIGPSADPGAPLAPSAAGWARVHGERWRVASATPIAAGRRVRVTGRNGLTLTVAPLVRQRRSPTRRATMMGFTFGFGSLLFVFALFLVASSIRIFREYERGVVFLLGRFWKVKGPGLVLIVPVIQQAVRIDLRTVVFDVPAQDVITRDNVSVKVSAVVYFRVVDPEKAVIQVARYFDATSQLAQTTLRAVLGKHELDALLAEREQLNADIQKTLDAQTDAWGIKVSTVEIKHVDLNETMIRAIARQAEAERERRAKVIHAEGELQASEQLLKAAQRLALQPQAMQLRYLQTLTTIAADKNSTIVFPLPIDLLSSVLERFGRAPQQ
ncbi:nodulation efficiency protein D [Burkholderia pseudomallei]|nr:nodulation efficiency protein D [Burkholderia pseudomallei]